MLRRILLIAFLALLFPVSPALLPAVHAADSLASYQLEYLGPGSPSAVNNSGTVVGASVSSDKYTPLVSVGGAAWSTLPAPWTV